MDQKRQSNGARRNTDVKLSPFKKLRGFKVGPVCLRCGEVVELKRQAGGHGWLHSQCEAENQAQLRVSGIGLHMERVGADDLVLVRDTLEDMQPVA